MCENACCRLVVEKTMLWLFGGALALVFARYFWLSHFSRVNVMRRQALSMNWLVIGQVANVEGGSDILLGRSGQGAKIDWRNGEVRLVNPSWPKCSTTSWPSSAGWCATTCCR